MALDSHATTNPMMVEMGYDDGNGPFIILWSHSRITPDLSMEPIDSKQKLVISYYSGLDDQDLLVREEYTHRTGVGWQLFYERIPNLDRVPPRTIMPDPPKLILDAS